MRPCALRWSLINRTLRIFRGKKESKKKRLKGARVGFGRHRASSHEVGHQELRRGRSLDPSAICNRYKDWQEHRWFFKKKGLGLRVWEKRNRGQRRWFFKKKGLGSRKKIYRGRTKGRCRERGNEKAKQREKGKFRSWNTQGTFLGSGWFRSWKELMHTAGRAS